MLAVALYYNFKLWSNRENQRFSASHNSLWAAEETKTFNFSCLFFSSVGEIICNLNRLQQHFAPLVNKVDDFRSTLSVILKHN